MDIWIYEYIYNSGVSCISGESSVSATPMFYPPISSKVHMQSKLDLIFF